MTDYAHTNGGPSAGDNPPTLNPADPVIRTERLTKRIRGGYIVRNVSMSVKPGEVYGLIGGQGAGKSTLTQLLLGFLHPDGGTVRLFGSESLRRARARVGYLPEKPRYHGNFTGRGYLRFHGELSGLKGREAQLVADRVADTVGLGQAARKLIGGYSKAARQKLGLAVALLAGGAEPPELLVLDEPATGHDEEIATLFRDVVLDCKARGSTVLVCSRELTLVERACTSVGILRAGRLLVQTHIDESPRTHLVGVAREGAGEILTHLTDYLNRLHPSVLVRGGASEGEHLHVVLPAGPGVAHAVAMKAAALRAMVDARWDIVSVYTENRDLESLFLQAVPPPDIKITPAKSPSKEAIEPVSDTAPDEASVRAAPDTGPLDNNAASIKASDTGPLPTLEASNQSEAAKSPDTGPLQAPMDGDGVAANGIGGPSTSPLPALETGMSTNGYEAALRPLPVRAVSRPRRAAEVAGEGGSVDGDSGE
ncbi:MAG TPA: ABC transporter ATP-binding protein [Chloroflexia bacterium]|nr:ABC transporter ATP-binding protein [Chloroflexia bacterium]